LTSFLIIIINVIDFLNSYFLNYYINFIRFKAVPSNQNRDNFIDKAFTVIAESIVKIMPIADKEKKAYIYYRDGLAAQNNGDYSEALEYYKESLLLEENKIDRGETLKNMAIIYMSNGEEDLSIETYQKALGENPKQPSCLKNIGLIYEKRGRYAEQNGDLDQRDIWFDKAAEVWSKAVRLYPGGYLDIENWLKNSGRSSIDMYL
jgi:tetratricopeptide (TPR) repeat protein